MKRKAHNKRMTCVRVCKQEKRKRAKEDLHVRVAERNVRTPRMYASVRVSLCVLFFSFCVYLLFDSFFPDSFCLPALRFSA
mmetsp:Transcript_40241/g.79333  ORF Transcript_40241/g.79333 Transcript_40241/m.79333 type:complete len:81 (-) Transcript_40241:2492-2734(-)